MEYLQNRTPVKHVHLLLIASGSCYTDQSCRCRPTLHPAVAASSGFMTSSVAQTKSWLQSLMPLLLDCWTEARPVTSTGQLGHLLFTGFSIAEATFVLMGLIQTSAHQCFFDLVQDAVSPLHHLYSRCKEYSSSGIDVELILLVKIIQDTIVLSVTSPNVYRFSKFFHCQTQQ